jgi:UDPglucose 6-dehydrogenase
MRLVIIGTGYVGLVSGVCLSAKGHDVTCVDLRPEIIAVLNAGRAPIHEPGLSRLLQETIAAGRFRATGDLNAALAGAALVLVAVGTPSEGGRIDLRFIGAAVRQIGEYLRRQDRYLSVVIKSTVIPGTTDTFVRQTLEQSSGKRLGQFGLGMNPEFLREGNAIEDFLEPDRIVLGYEDPPTLALLEELYRPWRCDKLAVNTRTAEMIKYANNCLLATQISAVNELANLASALGGVDVMDVMRGVHLDKRWNPLREDGTRTRPGILSYLAPGCGFGGSCFPKDVQALRSQGESLDLPMPLLNAVLSINEAQPSQVTELLRRHWGSVTGKRVLVLGLAFKPDTDDVRESASRKIIVDLLAAGAAVVAHDPVAAENARRSWPELAEADLTASWPEDLVAVDAVVVATSWPEYRGLLGAAHRKLLEGKVIVDARRFFRAEDFPSASYLAIGFSGSAGNAPAPLLEAVS